MARNQITFNQYQTEGCMAAGVISFELPTSIIEIGESIEYSMNGKLLPSYEGKIVFEVVLGDGTVTQISGCLALWWDKKHAKAAVAAAEQARKEAEQARKAAEVRAKRAELLKAFSAEQIQALAALGMLEEGE